MILLCEKYSVEVPADVKTSVSFKRVRHLMTYIKQNFDKKLTLELLANEVGINKYQLTREFKAATRQSLNEYINAYKVYTNARINQDKVLKAGYANDDRKVTAADEAYLASEAVLNQKKAAIDRAKLIFHDDIPEDESESIFLGLYGINRFYSNYVEEE